MQGTNAHVILNSTSTDGNHRAMDLAWTRQSYCVLIANTGLKGMSRDNKIHLAAVALHLQTRQIPNKAMFALAVLSLGVKSLSLQNTITFSMVVGQGAAINSELNMVLDQTGEAYLALDHEVYTCKIGLVKEVGNPEEMFPPRVSNIQVFLQSKPVPKSAVISCYIPTSIEDWPDSHAKFQACGAISTVSMRFGEHATAFQGSISLNHDGSRNGFLSGFKTNQSSKVYLPGLMIIGQPASSPRNLYSVTKARISPMLASGRSKVLFLERNSFKSISSYFSKNSTGDSVDHAHCTLLDNRLGDCHEKLHEMELVASSLEQFLAITTLSETRNVLLLDINHQVSTPYASSCSWFYEQMHSIEKDLKFGVVMAALGAKFDAIEPLNEGIAMASMQEINRKWHIPFLKICDTAVSLAVLRSAMSSSGEMSVDMHRDHLECCRFAERHYTPRNKVFDHLDESTNLQLHCIIVSGGTRGLGYRMALQLAGKSVIHILTSLTGSIEDRLLINLQKKSHSVFVKKCDWSCENSVRNLLKWTHENMPFVSSIVHAAGTMIPCQIRDMTESIFDSVAACKVQSLKLSKSLPCHRQLIISSISGIWSQTGGSHYTAASVYQMRHASRMHDQGHNMLSVSFGPFEEIGMVAEHAEDMRTLGIVPMKPEELIYGFKAAALPNSIFVELNIDKFLEYSYLKGPMMIFDALQECNRTWKGGMQNVIVTSTKPTTSFSKYEIEEQVVAIMVDYLGCDEDEIDFAHVDSVTAVELSESFSKAFAQDLPATLIYDYPSIEALVGHFESIMNQVEEVDISQSLENNILMQNMNTDTVGYINSRLPALRGEEAIGMTPVNRWRVRYDNYVAMPFGAWLDGVEKFDSFAFGLSSNEAQVMDPQHRALLELVSESMNGGMANERSGGVYVGIQHAEYVSIFNAFNQEINAFSSTSSAFSVAAGRISFIFGLQGPAMSLDTACSSAFSALHVARSDLLSRTSEYTITCTVNLMLSEKTTRSTLVSGMLSTEGRCKTLDESADGYVRADAVVALIMEMDHEASNILEHRISGYPVVIKASCVNQDGRTSTLTAPNGPSQQRVIMGALLAANSTIADLSCLQLHGTGTSLGDPIELGSLINVFGDILKEKYVVASKSAQGHAEPASGFVGLVQVSMQLQGHHICHVRHLKRLNQFISSSFKSSRLPNIPRQNASLVCQRYHHQGISAFAFQGTNTHVIASPRDKMVSFNCQINCIWMKSRFWFTEPANILIHSYHSANHGNAVFSVDHASVKTILLDHIVSGRAILPASAMLEMCWSVASCLAKQVGTVILHNFNIQKAAILSSNMVETSLEVKQSKDIVSIYNNAAMISESGISTLGSANVTQRKLSMKDRLYMQFINAASTVLGFTMSHAMSVDLHPVALIDDKRFTYDGLCLRPDVLDAATHVQAAGSQTSSNIFLPSTVESICLQEDTNAELEPYAYGSVHFSNELLHSTLALSGRKSVTVSGLTSKNLERNLKEASSVDTLMVKQKFSVALNDDLVSIEVDLSLIVKDVLGVGVDRDQPLYEAGVDSLVSVDIIESINSKYSIDLPSTTLFDAPTIESLASLVLDRTLPVIVPDSPQSITTQSLGDMHVKQPFGDTDVSILDNCVRYPSVSMDNPLKPIFNGISDICAQIPYQRWDVEDTFDIREQCRSGMSYVRFGKFLEKIEWFDSDLFNMSANESQVIDPQQRMLMEDISTLIVPRKFSLLRFTGVFIGCMYSEYLQLQCSLGNKVTGSMITGNGLSYLPARISYAFNLQGPSVSTDTACSSSLVSLHQAVSSIKHDGIQTCIVSGVNLMLLQATTMSICQLSALSESGRCKTFDASADGYGRGEAVVTLVVGHDSAKNSLAGIVSTKVNQDGRSNGISAPNGQSQTSLLKAGIALFDSEGIVHSCHGTGTELGDPIEVNAFRRAWYAEESSTPIISTLASSKSIVGHTEGAAGLSGLILCLETIKCNIGSEVANLRTLNSYVANVMDQLLHIKRQEGPSNNIDGNYSTTSFGMGGTNAYAGLCRSRGDPAFPSSSRWKSTTLSTKHRYWPIPLLHPSLFLKLDKDIAWNIRLMQPDNNSLFDHAVHGRVIVPGAFWVDIASSCCQALNAGQKRVGLKESMFLNPYIVSEVSLRNTLTIRVDERSGGVFVFRGASRGTEEQIFASKGISEVALDRSGTRVLENYKPFLLKESIQPNSVASLLKRERAVESLLDPTCLDAQMHFAAAIVGSKVTSLPVNIQLIKPMAENSCSGKSVGISATISTDGSMRSYASISCASPDCGTHILGLESIETQVTSEYTKPKLFNQASSRDTSVAVSHELYEISYSVAMICDEMDLSQSLKPSLTTCHTNLLPKVQSNDGSISLINTMMIFHGLSSQGLENVSFCTMDSFVTVPELKPQVNPQNVALWGLIRSLQTEKNNQMSIGALDFDSRSHMRSNGHQKVGVDGKVHRARTVHIPLLVETEYVPKTSPSSNMFSCNYSVVLGGTSGIGDLSCKWMTQKGQHTISTGRTGYLAHVREGTITKSDVSVMEDFAYILENRRYFENCFHSGGVNADRIIAQQSPDTIRMVFGPKAGSLSTCAHTYSRCHFNTLVMFSSISSMIGTAGQSNYCAANLFLEGVTARLSNSGLSVRAIAWGAWSGIGMAMHRSKVLDNAKMYGLGVIDPRLGLLYLENVLNLHSGSTPVAIASPFDFTGAFWKRDIISYDLQKSDINPIVKSKGSEISKSSITERIQFAVEALTGQVVSESDPLMHAGLDSLSSIELKDTISEMFDVKLQSTLIFDYPSITAIADHVKSLMSEAGSQDSIVLETRISGVAQSLETEILILGIDSSIPSTVTMKNDMGSVLVSGADLQRVIGQERWDVDQRYSHGHDRIHTRFAAFFDDITSFDASVFNMTADQSMVVDPQQRFLLQGALNLLVGKGAWRSGPTGTLLLHSSHLVQSGYVTFYFYINVGTYVGCMNFEYPEVLARSQQPITSFSATGSAGSFMVGRLSYHFGLNGPSILSDTACSSSLVALHLARLGLIQDNVTGSLVGGVNLMLSSTTMLALSSLQALSVDGRCKALDGNANGYGRSEASIVLFVSNKAQDYDSSAILRSSLINQDGRSSSLTSPNGPSQAKLISDAMSFQNIQPYEIGTVSIHGTGTPLGDPIELNALRSTFTGRFSVSIQALKSFTGHSEGAAGLSGLLQVIYSSSKHVVSPIKHLRRLNFHISQIMETSTGQASLLLPRERSAFTHNDVLSQSSSFGMSGTNATAIISSGYRTNPVVFSKKVTGLNLENLWPENFVRTFTSASASKSHELCKFQAGNSPNIEYSLEQLTNTASLCIGFVMHTQCIITAGHIDHSILEAMPITRHIGRNSDLVTCEISSRDGTFSLNSGLKTFFNGHLAHQHAPARQTIGVARQHNLLFKPSLATTASATAECDNSGTHSTEYWKTIHSSLDLRKLFDNSMVRRKFIGMTTFTMPQIINFTQGTIGTSDNTLSCGDIRVHFDTISGIEPPPVDHHDTYVEAWHAKEMCNPSEQRPSYALLMQHPESSSSYSAFLIPPNNGLTYKNNHSRLLPDIVAPGAFHVAFLMEFSVIRRVVLLDTYKNHVQSILPIYDMFSSFNWERDITLSRLEIQKASEFGTSPQNTLADALARTLFIEKRHLFAPKILLNHSEDDHIIKFDFLEKMMCSSGEYEFKVDGNRGYVRRLTRAPASRLKIPLPQSIVVKGGTQVIYMDRL